MKSTVNRSSLAHRTLAVPGPDGTLPHTPTERLPDELPESEAGDELPTPLHADISPAPVQDASPEEPKRRSRALPVILFLILVALVAGGYFYYLSLGYEKTDDAFIEGRIVQISPKASGHVSELLVTDNQQVKAGDVLLRIDPRDYQSKVAQARAALEVAEARLQAAQSNVTLTSTTATSQLESARAGVASAEARLASARTGVTQAQARLEVARAGVQREQAGVSSAQAEAQRATADAARYRQLVGQGAVSRQQAESASATAISGTAGFQSARQRVASAEAELAQAVAGIEASRDTVRTAEAALIDARAKLVEAQAGPEQVAAARAQAASAAADVDQTRASLQQAELNLSYTTVTAPQDGVITRRQVEQGSYVSPGQALLALVPRDYWVVANFKETQLRRMKPGQEVEIKVDAYPKHPFKGHIESFQTGSGSRFSLLPPENATGNFVKVVQRVPVKIVFDEQPDPARYRIGPGMSVEPEVVVK